MARILCLCPDCHLKFQLGKLDEKKDPIQTINHPVYGCAHLAVYSE